MRIFLLAAQCFFLGLETAFLIVDIPQLVYICAGISICFMFLQLSIKNEDTLRNSGTL